MALRDDLVTLVDEVRDEIVDDEVGLRLYTVQTRRRVWSGASVGQGSVTDTDVALAPVPKVRAPTGRKTDDGREHRPDLLITKISATYAEAALTGGSLAANERFYWLVDGEYYRVLGRPEKRYLEWQVGLAALMPLSWVQVSATVITPSARTLDPASGIVSETTTSTAITAWVGPTAFSGHGGEEDLVQRRRLTLYALMDDLPTRPTISSRFQVDGRTYRVVSAEVEPYGLYWRLTGEESS